MRPPKWSEEETILAFYYYCQIPFGRIHHTNPEIIRIAKLIGRSVGAVVFKMGNLAHFDPEQRKRNINGLQHASKLDEVVVNEFHDDWEQLTIRAQAVEAQYQKKSLEELLQIQERQLPPGITREAVIQQRVNQNFFRLSVLSAYDSRCCITGIENPQLLIASHIKPWAQSDIKTERTNPCNGLCLNALHDRAFDQGLITVLPDFKILVSEKLSGDDDGTLWLKECNGKKIQLPKRFVPQKEFLEYHNDIIFQK